MKERIVFAAVVLALVCILAVSCSDYEGQGTDKLVDVTLVSVVSKEINLTGQSELTKYSFKATPMFSAKGDARNEGSEVKTTDIITSSSQTFRNLSQGKWKFEVTGYNASNKKMYYGSVEKDVTASTSTVTVLLESSQDAGQGTLKLNVSAAKVGNNPSIKYEVSDYNGPMAQSEVCTSETDVSLSDTITLTQGLHTVSIFNYDGETVVGGEIFTINVVPGDVIMVSGSLDAGSYQDVTLKVWEFGGSIEEDEDTEGLYRFVLKNDLPDGVSSTDISYQWYLNGIELLQQNAATYTFSSDNPCGYYCISCIACFKTNKAVVSSSIYKDHTEKSK